MLATVPNLNEIQQVVFKKKHANGPAMSLIICILHISCNERCMCAVDVSGCSIGMRPLMFVF